MLPSQESHVKIFAENKGKEDTRMDIIIHPQDAVRSPNPSALPHPNIWVTNLSCRHMLHISWKRTKILETLKHKCKGKAFHRHNICVPQ
jgi:hypothetical protein